MIKISELTIDEKLGLLTGASYWTFENANGKLPTIRVTDGPLGVRKVERSYQGNGNYKIESIGIATAMPSLQVLANTWNTSLAYEDGKTIADEAIEYGSDILLAPGVNIKRTPLCGRNFEYFSEDPYLSGLMGKAYIEGVQDKGIGACLKHFCANNREYDRMYMSSEVDNRTLHEIYLKPFEIATKAEPWSVMCSYNLINGIYAAENEYLLEDVLRGEFGFDGIVVSDWLAVKSPERAHKVGLEIEMPMKESSFAKLKKAYNDGYLTDEIVDKLVTRILMLIEKSEEGKKKRKVEFTAEDRHNVARRIATEGAVLLKNEDNILPLKTGKIYVTGPLVKPESFGGGGSSKIQTPYKSEGLVVELQRRLPSEAVVFGDNTVYRFNGKMVRENAIHYNAYNSDTVVFWFGNNETIESEELDRTNIKLHARFEELINETAKLNKNIVVIITAGSAIDMSAWIDSVKAVLYVGFGGEGVVESTADLLSGVANPSGKLSETFPLSLEDCPVPVIPDNPFVDRYTEGIFVGYRYYDTFNKEVLYPFGHGLSYSSFEYSSLEIEKLDDTKFKVSFNVKNTSEFDGKEVCQLYVKDVFSSVSRPEKELKAFTKIELKAGEVKRVELELSSDSFAFFSEALNKWHIENGTFEILVGASSRDIRLVGKIDIELPFYMQYTRPWNF